MSADEGLLSETVCLTPVSEQDLPALYAHFSVPAHWQSVKHAHLKDEAELQRELFSIGKVKIWKVSADKASAPVAYASYYFGRLSKPVVSVTFIRREVDAQIYRDALLAMTLYAFDENVGVAGVEVFLSQADYDLLHSSVVELGFDPNNEDYPTEPDNKCPEYWYTIWLPTYYAYHRS